MALLTMDEIIFDATETKIRLLVNDIYDLALRFKDCRDKSLRIGNPFDREGVTTYIEYISLMDTLNVQFCNLDDYLALAMSYINNVVY